MNCIIRKIENTSSEYLAYIKLDHCIVYSIYFHDNILGAIGLNNFINMIKKNYQNCEIALKVNEKEISFKNKKLLELLREKE